MCNPLKTKLDANSAVHLNVYPCANKLHCLVSAHCCSPHHSHKTISFFFPFSTPQKWDSLSPIRPKQYVFCFPSPCGPQNVGFISLSLITPKQFGSFAHYMFVSLPATYDPNGWFVKLRPECSHKMCVVSLHLTTQHRWVSFPSAPWPENNLTYVSLSSINPPNWGFVLQSQNMGFISTSTTRPKTATRFVSLSPMAHKKLVSLPSALYTQNNMCLLPLASWAQEHEVHV